jgi:DNA-binding transcriptional MerR regulator
MRISELSRHTGVPVATVKYYLREGLLPRGEPMARNQAEYGEGHVHRVQLIRALREVAGLGIGQVRRVVAALDDEGLGRHQLFGVAQRAIEPQRRPPPRSAEEREARADIDQFLEELGWQTRDDAAARDDLAAALLGLRTLGRAAEAAVFRPYADVADRLAAWEVSAIPPSEPAAVAVERMVVGTLLYGAALDALRRLAHEHHSARRS